MDHLPRAKRVFPSPSADPSIAIDVNNKIYYSYVRNEPVAAGNPPEGHARVAVANGSGTTINWINDIDIGATHGVKNAAEIKLLGVIPAVPLLVFLEAIGLGITRHSLPW